jgi:acetyl esterase/lipase
MAPLDLTLDLPVPGGAWPLSVHLVFTADGLYVPAVVRRPAGPGPFPTIIVLHGGSGGLGVTYLVDHAQHQGWALDALLARGYAVVLTEGRMEHEDAYGTDIPFELDHRDVIAALQHVGRQPWADPARIGFLGVSHGGELQMKLAHAIADRTDVPAPAALTMCEPAVIEFLGLRYEGVRKEANLQFREPISDSRIDRVNACARIARLPDDLPMLVIGRDEDHLQGLFMKLRDLLAAAGKNVHWTSFSHPEHAYQLGPRRGPDGYVPDPVHTATLEHILEFLDTNVRDRR